jgi:hypothetical protein
MPFGRRITVLCALCVLFSAGRFSTAAATELSHFNRGTWPFCPPERPAVPQVVDQSWVKNPIDAFVLARLEAKQLSPSEQADRLTLLRRISFDLTGLPPSPEEQAKFLSDEAEGAYERVVDRLLASPHYGERWAQHWLDVVRYAETDGFKADEFRPEAYKYRDYVIRAFNADLPYDRFIRQQLAGDELEPDNPEAIVATGLNRLYPDESNAADVIQRRQEIHDNLTDTTALAFLGLTVGCAQCHDHKFDPITQRDYFRLQSFFSTLLPRDDMPVAEREEIEAYAAQRAEWEQASAPIRSELDALLAKRKSDTMRNALEKFRSEIRVAVETPAEERTCLQQQIAFQAMRYVSPKMAGVSGESLKGDEKQRFDELSAELARFDHLRPADLPVAMAVSDASADAPPTYVLTLGDYRKPEDEVTPGFPAFLGASEPAIVTPPAGEHTSGRRAALANWLCRPDHPLTARVMVNRVWQHHFGVGIVATPNDFGAMGEPPTHPELLDWLAIEFVESGWSLKALHKLIVTSAVYQQASRVDVDNPAQARALAADRQNRLLWHARRQRLEGEIARDAILQIAGDLSPAMFGRSARPDLPRGVGSKAAWNPDGASPEQNRRSIYVFAKRNLRFPLFEIFDQPDLQMSCPQRSVTTTAPQALTLLNGEFSIEQANRWAQHLLQSHNDDDGAIVDDAWSNAFARPPAAQERQAATGFILTQAKTISERGASSSEAHREAVADFCHALFNSNEFLYVD